MGPAQDLDQHEGALLARSRLEYLLEEAAEPLEWAALDLDWLTLLKEGFFWGSGLAQLVNGLDQCVGDAGGVLRYPKTQQVQDALGRPDRCPVGLLGLATHKAVPRKEGLGLADQLTAADLLGEDGRQVDLVTLAGQVLLGPELLMRLGVAHAPCVVGVLNHGR